MVTARAYLLAIASLLAGASAMHALLAPDLTIPVGESKRGATPEQQQQHQ